MKQVIQIVEPQAVVESAIQIALQGRPGPKPTYEELVDLTPLKQAQKELGITGSY